MNLYDILACPNCKVAVIRSEIHLFCPQCAQTYPIVNGIPIMLPDGNLPEIQHEAELIVRESYVPWIHRTVLQSLLDNQIVLELGAGSMALDDPCIIRTDITLTPYVDVVADAHALPFLPGTFDFVFSLAVFEHLRTPFLAAQQIYEVLKDGGYIYHECNFVFAYHGYPHHYFNASLQGMKQLFEQFVPLRKGVAPYQMPSFTLDTVAQVYLQHTNAHQYPHGRRLIKLLQELVEINSVDYDIYFSEEDALYVAAGTYFAGFKQNTVDSSVIPEVIRNLWRTEIALQSAFPKISDLFTTENILVWAKRAGREKYALLNEFIEQIVPFHKKGEQRVWDRSHIQSLDLVDAKYTAVGYPAGRSQTELSQMATSRHNHSYSIDSAWKRGLTTLRHRGLRQFMHELLSYIDRHI
ncbi:MAG: methyltransferase domain-containing protein [Caldilineaceae bacterium]